MHEHGFRTLPQGGREGGVEIRCRSHVDTLGPHTQALGGGVPLPAARVGDRPQGLPEFLLASAAVVRGHAQATRSLLMAIRVRELSGQFLLSRPPELLHVEIYWSDRPTDHQLSTS